MGMTNQEEQNYLDLVRECIEKGSKQNDRTRTGTFALFGKQLRFSLSSSILPLLTTKSVPFHMVLKELLFFIRGQTDNKILKKENVHIWDGNGSKEFLNSRGIDREEDDLGPIYGFQWRHYGAEYKTCNDDYTGKGIDQLQSVIESIRKDPYSRRMIVVSWNPKQLDEMALPPCHTLFHFLVSDKKLSLILYQRSGDIGLGIPFNIASYSLLTLMVAKITNLEAHEFIHFIGDAHVYSNHVEALKIQLAREPKKFPKIVFSDKEYKEIDDFNFEDFSLEGYEPHPKIVMKMSV
jgi:thymidylate synthase